MSQLRANRNFRLLWTGQAISVVGSRASAVAYPLLVLAMTGSPALAGIIGFLGTAPYILFQLPAGAVADRVNRRRMMIVCDLGRMIALASIPVGAWLGRLTLPQIAIAAFVEGSLFVFFRLGEISAIRIVVDQEQHAGALAQNEARLRAASLSGVPLHAVSRFVLPRARKAWAGASGGNRGASLPDHHASSLQQLGRVTPPAG